MGAVERSPAAATQQPELTVHVFNSWIYLRPHVGLDNVDLDRIVVLSVGKNTAKLDQLTVADRTQTRVGCWVLARSDHCDFLGLGVEHLAFFEDFLAVGHASSDVYQLFVA